MLTVFIATYNRSQLLRKTLGRLTHLQSPASGWKLVVIDNGSTDDTRHVVLSFKDRLPLTYKFERVLGKNAALNTGLAELEGDLAVFTDDDVSPNPDWLIQLRTAADEHPEFQMFGGAILPGWEVEPPEWLASAPQAPLFSLTDSELRQGPTESGNLFGPNVAIRSQIFARGTRFDESIGPRGKNYPMGSETELLLRLGQQGYKAWHVPDAVVEHYIRKDQMSRSWVLKRAIRHGRGQFRLSELHSNRRLPWLILAASIAPRMLRRILRIAGAWLVANHRSLLTAQWELNFNVGLLIEAYHMQKETPRLISPALSANHKSN